MEEIFVSYYVSGFFTFKIWFGVINESVTAKFPACAILFVLELTK